MKILIDFSKHRRRETPTYLEAGVNRVFVRPILGCMPGGHHTNGGTTNPSRGEHYASSYLATSALEIPDMVSPQRALRYPYNKVQGPPTIVG